MRFVKAHAYGNDFLLVPEAEAESDPSAVTTVQPSAFVSTSWLPRVSIGSIARQIPGSSRIPRAGVR